MCVQSRIIVEGEVRAKMQDLDKAVAYVENAWSLYLYDTSIRVPPDLSTVHYVLIVQKANISKNEKVRH